MIPIPVLISMTSFKARQLSRLMLGMIISPIVFFSYYTLTKISICLQISSIFINYRLLNRTHNLGIWFHINVLLCFTLVLSLATSLQLSCTATDPNAYAKRSNDTLFYSDNKSMNASTAVTHANEVYKSVAKSQKEPRSYRIGFVEPTFTYAAYQNNSFYNFYSKYQQVKPGANITSDIYLLKDRRIPLGPYILYNDKPGDKPSIQYASYFMNLLERVKEALPEALVDNITDVDVHGGRIFNSASGSNAYDILFLFHNEYVTQQEYDNLKRFVKNGGVVVFTDANMLYAEVKYDSQKNSISLVKGHKWEFDGSVARQSVYERWQNETRDWVGSNFMYMRTVQADLGFTNLPFTYKHSEEQYVTNRNVNILHNHGVYDPKDNSFDPTVATYEKEYGKGKVIMIGLYGHTIVGKEGFEDFLRFFDYFILTHSLDTNVYRSIDKAKGIPVHYLFKNNGLISTVEVDNRTQVIKLALERPLLRNDTLTVTIPRSIINPMPNNQFQSVSGSYTVFADGRKIEFDHFVLDSEIGFRIYLPPSTAEIQIMYILPKFSFAAPQDLTVIAEGEFTPVTLGRPEVGCSNSNPIACQNLIINNTDPLLFPVGTSYVEWMATESDSGTYIKDTQKVLVNDEIPPNVTLSGPLPDISTLANFSGPYLVQGTVYDSIGIEKVESFVYIVPFNGQYPYKTAQLEHDGNQSRWSIVLEPDISEKKDNSTEIGLIIRATDKADNKNWYKTKYLVEKRQ
jgi:hypothetical protein